MMEVIIDTCEMNWVKPDRNDTVSNYGQYFPWNYIEVL